MSLARFLIYIQEAACFRVNDLDRIIGVVDEGAKQSQRVMRPSEISNVLHDAEQSARLPCTAPRDFALAADVPDFAAGPDNAVFRLIARTLPRRRCNSLSADLPVLGIHMNLPLGPCMEIFLRLEAEYVVGFIRGCNDIGFEVVFPMPEVGDVLGFIELGCGFQQ